MSQETALSSAMGTHDHEILSALHDVPQTIIGLRIDGQLHRASLANSRQDILVPPRHGGARRDSSTSSFSRRISSQLVTGEESCESGTPQTTIDGRGWSFRQGRPLPVPSRLLNAALFPSQSCLATLRGQGPTGCELRASDPA
jgi:hypothetical protein